VHPLEEAFAFHALLHTEGLQYDINSLAVKAGKSPSFIAQRLKGRSDRRRPCARNRQAATGPAAEGI
jgi:hypothetical protein